MKELNRTIGLLVAVLAAGITLPAYAQIQPGGYFHYFEANERPVKNIKVYNRSPDRTIEVKAIATKVLNPGEKPERLEKGKGLVVSPSKFKLKPNSDRMVRMILKKKPKDTEEVYRVTFRPVSASGPAAPPTNVGDKMNVKMKVLIGAGVIAFARPAKKSPSISWSKSGSSYSVTNTGNVNVLFSACKPQGTCEDSREGGRLYPGKTKKVSVSGTGLKIMRELPGGGTESFLVDKPTGSKTFTGIPDKPVRKK
jgi:P pilus assembly chaperone PapD